MACCKKGTGSSNKPVQKVVIPKGMINPGETTIIEIPSNLQKQPIVVAKRKTSLDSVNYNNKAAKPSGKRCGGGGKGRANDKEKRAQGNSRASSQGTSDLEATEKKEREQFLKDLEDFQRARRKLLSNASFLAGEKSSFRKK